MNEPYSGEEALCAFVVQKRELRVSRSRRSQVNQDIMTPSTSGLKLNELIHNCTVRKAASTANCSDSNHTTPVWRRLKMLFFL